MVLFLKWHGTLGVERMVGMYKIADIHCKLIVRFSFRKILKVFKRINLLLEACIVVKKGCFVCEICS